MLRSIFNVFDEIVFVSQVAEMFFQIFQEKREVHGLCRGI